jgi:hypothetical protein
VVREAQETVELALKGMLRAVGVEPPKFHDVGWLVLDHKDRFAEEVSRELTRAAEISKRLRKEYTADDATLALSDAKWIVELAKKAFAR